MKTSWEVNISIWFGDIRNNPTKWLDDYGHKEFYLRSQMFLHLKNNMLTIMKQSPLTQVWNA